MDEYQSLKLHAMGVSVPRGALKNRARDWQNYRDTHFDIHEENK